MVVIQKVIFHLCDCLRTMDCAFQTRQNAKSKVRENFGQKITELKASVSDFTISCFQLIPTNEKSKMLPQDFDYSFHSREKSFSSSLQAACIIHPSFSILVQFSPLRFFGLSQTLNDMAFCVNCVLETLEKKKVTRYLLS